MFIPATKMQTLILDSLKETPENNPMPCSELARIITFKEKIIKDVYISYACLPADFRDSFQKALQYLISQQKVQFLPSNGSEPWSGYVCLQ